MGRQLWDSVILEAYRRYSYRMSEIAEYLGVHGASSQQAAPAAELKR